MFNNLTPFVPLSFKGEGEELFLKGPALSLFPCYYEMVVIKTSDF